MKRRKTKPAHLNFDVQDRSLVFRLGLYMDSIEINNVRLMIFVLKVL